jgi:hypothetical protein
MTALLLGLALAAPMAAEAAIPFKGTIEGSFTSTLNPGPPPVATIDLSGTGNATLLGSFSFELPHTVNFGTLPPTGSGTYTFTAANGDSLHADIVGHSAPVEPGVVLVMEEAVITGGTGRFSGAAGAFSVLRVVIQSSGITFGSFDGTISCLGAGLVP